MNTSGNFNGNIGTPTNQFNLKVEYTIKQSIIDNYSDITATGYCQRNNANAWPQNTTSNAIINIGGNSITTHPGYNITTDGYKQIITHTARIYHDNNGKKTITISFSFDGLLYNYYPNGSVSRQITLPDIPRASDIKIPNNDIIIGENLNIEITKKVSDYTDNLKIEFGSFVKNIDNVSTPYEWDTSIDANELYNQMPTVSSLKGKATVETYSGDTSIGSNSAEFTLRITDANPIFNNFTYEDTNPKTLGLTGDNQTVIKGYSNVKGIISVSDKAVAQKGATIRDYLFVIGTKQKNINYSDTEEVSDTIDQVDVNIFNMYAKDSRGLSTLKTISPNIFIDYKKINILKMSVERSLGGVGEDVTISFNGEFWNGSFGISDNDVTATYRYRRTTESEWHNGTSTITVIKSENKYSFTGKIAGDLSNTGFNVSNSYEIEITVKDKLDQYSDTTTFGSGTPSIALHKNGTAFGGLYSESVNGTLQIHQAENGSVLTINEEEVAELTSGSVLNIYANKHLDNGKRLLTEDDLSSTTRDIITAKCSGSETSQSLTAWSSLVINLKTYVRSGTKLSFSTTTHAVTIGSGVSKVMVSGQANLSWKTSNNTEQYLIIIKNGVAVTTYHSSRKNGTAEWIGITPIMVEVTSGDKLTLEFQADAGGTFVCFEQTYLTVEVIE